ncbi:hypothetical protein MASR2M66_03200 [Chloroflexota bacterium]
MAAIATSIAITEQKTARNNAKKLFNSAGKKEKTNLFKNQRTSVPASTTAKRLNIYFFVMVKFLLQKLRWISLFRVEEQLN